MALATEPLSGAPPTLRELRELWERGERTRALRTALEAWDELAGQAGERRWLEEALRTVGLPAEAFALQAQTTRQRNNVAAWESLIRSALQTGDPWWTRELLSETTVVSRALQAIAIEVALVFDDAAELISAWVRDHQDEAAREVAVGWWLRSGRLHDAERVLAETPGLTRWRARLALWRKQPDTARALLETLPASAEVNCLWAVVAIQEGWLEEAEARLRTLLDSEVQAEAWGWLATVLRKQKRYAAAVQSADAANAASVEFNLALRMERELSVELDAASTSHGSRLRRLLASVGVAKGPNRAAMRTIGVLRHGWALAAFGLRPEDPTAALEGLLERIGGNHTPHVTTIEDGQLRFHPIPPDPGQLGPSVQRVLSTRGAAATRTLYRAMSAQLNGHPSFRIYYGEFELWMGEYEEAGRIFREVLAQDPNVKWAWIGLGASAMLRGEFSEAQQIWARGLSITGSGPTLYAYRGECYRRQGRRVEARQDLEVALRDKPQRLSSWINLALLDGQRAGQEEVERKCVELAPFLMGELSGSAAERLESVLLAMRGNRSSTRVTYHLWGRVWQL